MRFPSASGPSFRCSFCQPTFLIWHIFSLALFSAPTPTLWCGWNLCMSPVHLLLVLSSHEFLCSPCTSVIRLAYEKQFISYWFPISSWYVLSDSFLKLAGNDRKISFFLEILAFLLLRPAYHVCFSSLRLRGSVLEPKRTNTGYTYICNWRVTGLISLKHL